jgi:hypothetical protein
VGSDLPGGKDLAEGPVDRTMMAPAQAADAANSATGTKAMMNFILVSSTVAGVSLHEIAPDCILYTGNSGPGLCARAQRSEFPVMADHQTGLTIGPAMNPPCFD